MAKKQKESEEPEVETGEFQEEELPLQEKPEEWATPEDVMKGHLGAEAAADDGFCRLVGSILYLSAVRVPSSIIESLQQDMPRYGVRVVVLPGHPANHLDKVEEL